MTLTKKDSLVERPKKNRNSEAVNLNKIIASTSTDMLALLDNKYTYLAANTAYVDKFGFSLDQMIGKTVTDVFGDEYFNNVIKPDADGCVKGEEVNYRIWVDFPSSGRGFMNITYFPNYKGDNKIVGFVVNARYITEKKQTETALQEREKKAKLGLMFLYYVRKFEPKITDLLHVGVII